MVVKLITKDALTAQDIREAIARMSDIAEKEVCVAYAATIITADGRTLTQKCSRGHRCQLLGSVTDLQYDLMKSGDA